MWDVDVSDMNDDLSMTRGDFEAAFAEGVEVEVVTSREEYLRRLIGLQMGPQADAPGNSGIAAPLNNGEPVWLLLQGGVGEVLPVPAPSEASSSSELPTQMDDLEPSLA